MSDDAHRIGKSATNGAGTPIYTGTYMDNFNGVVGSTYLLMTERISEVHLQYRKRVLL